MWNIGRIWLRFFTDTTLRIKYHDQIKINKLIDQSVPQADINGLLKKLLTWDKHQRISFETFLEDEMFVDF